MNKQNGGYQREEGQGDDKEGQGVTCMVTEGDGRRDQHAMDYTGVMLQRRIPETYMLL